MKFEYNVDGTQCTFTEEAEHASTPLRTSAFWLLSNSTLSSGTIDVPNDGTPLYRPPTAYFEGGQLSMRPGSLCRAVSSGLLQLKLPSVLMKDIAVLAEFNIMFHKLVKWTTGYNRQFPSDNPIQGFMIDQNKPTTIQEMLALINQVWRLNALRGEDIDNWKNLPQRVISALESVIPFYDAFFSAFLAEMGIPKSIQSQLLCGISDGKGDQYALWNAYRAHDWDGNPINATWGLRPHRDYGGRTAGLSPLYESLSDVAPNSGLYASIDNQWQLVALDEGTVFFNFGSALEHSLSNYTVPGCHASLKSVVHFVNTTNTARHSFVNFNDPNINCEMQSLSWYDSQFHLRANGTYLDRVLAENDALYNLNEDEFSFKQSDIDMGLAKTNILMDTQEEGSVSIAHCSRLLRGDCKTKTIVTGVYTPEIYSASLGLAGLLFYLPVLARYGVSPQKQKAFAATVIAMSLYQNTMIKERIDYTLQHESNTIIQAGAHSSLSAFSMISAQRIALKYGYSLQQSHQIGSAVHWGFAALEMAFSLYSGTGILPILTSGLALLGMHFFFQQCSSVLSKENQLLTQRISSVAMQCMSGKSLVGATSTVVAAATGAQVGRIAAERLFLTDDTSISQG